jgi:hypothetical protein
MPLTLYPPVLDTILGCLGAILVFALIVSYPESVRTYRRVALAALFLSFIPDVLLATSHEMGGGWPEAAFLMIMHVVVWAICITLLPALSMTSHPETSAKPHRLSILERRRRGNLATWRRTMIWVGGLQL